MNHYGVTISFPDRPSINVDDYILDLIEKGCDVDAVFCNRETPLHYAVRRPSVAHQLIKNGANINARDGNGWSPLQEAIDSNNKESICMLLYYGADVNLRNRNEYTPLMEGIEKRLFAFDPEMASWLLNLHGKFTSKGNYPNLFKSSIAQPVDEADRIRLVTEIWKKLDHDTMLPTKSLFLSSFLPEKRFRNTEWLTGLYSMLDTPDIAEVIAYISNRSRSFLHFSTISSAFFWRELHGRPSKALTAHWLSLGAQSSFDDVGRKYRYSVWEEMELLIFATPVPLLTFVLGMRRRHGKSWLELRDRFLFDFIWYRQRSEKGFICRSLQYFSWNVFEREMIAAVYKHNAKAYEKILRALEKTPMVASLLEICRDLVVTAIHRNISQGYRSTCGAAEFHAAVDRLEVAEGIMDIINFRRPLYTGSN